MRFNLDIKTSETFLDIKIFQPEAFQGRETLAGSSRCQEKSKKKTEEEKDFKSRNYQMILILLGYRVTYSQSLYHSKLENRGQVVSLCSAGVSVANSC